MIVEDFSVRGKLQDVGRWYITRFVHAVASELPARARVLDAGAGEGVYRPFFNHCDYKTIDLAVGEARWNYSELDYVGPLHQMPIEDATFDAVLCTQVLEHLEWPRESVLEMNRVLKPGGKLFMTVPMSHTEHQTPYDFFRYTSYGLRSICQHAGFSEVHVRPMGGIFVRWAYELPRSLDFFPTVRSLKGGFNSMGVAMLPLRWASLGVLRLLQRFFLWADRFDAIKNDPFGWTCVATK
jgi:SAM-dependent methyltransferase